jgi:zinc finger MYND domain-containing protein 10
VLSAALTHDKLPLLVHALLTAELWREHVLPELLDHVSRGGSSLSMRVYFVLHHECVLANLLECLLYHDYAATAVGDGLLDLVDYCARRVAQLVAVTHARGAGSAAATGEDEALPADSKAAAALLERDAADPTGAARRHVTKMCAQTAFLAGVTSVTLLRYLADHAPRLPLSVMTRLLDTHDVALLMVHLLDTPPWVRRVQREEGVGEGAGAGAGAGGEGAKKTVTRTVWQKFDELRWRDVDVKDLLKLTQLEGQPWLTAHALLLEPDCRRRYTLTQHRRSQIGRIRKYLNDLLLDQLPVLVDLQRYIDEMSMGGVQDAAVEGGAAGALLLEALPVMREGIVEEALRGEGEGDGGDGGDGGEALSLVSVGRRAARAPRLTWPEVAARIARGAMRVRRTGGKKKEGGDAAGSDDDADLVALGDYYTEDAFDEGLLGEPKCARCGKAAEKRCSRCQNEWYCGRECQVAAWKGHKVVCDIVVAGGRGR